MVGANGRANLKTELMPFRPWESPYFPCPTRRLGLIARLSDIVSSCIGTGQDRMGCVPPIVIFMHIEWASIGVLVVGRGAASSLPSHYTRARCGWLSRSFEVGLLAHAR